MIGEMRPDYEIVIADLRNDLRREIETNRILRIEVQRLRKALNEKETPSDEH